MQNHLFPGPPVTPEYPFKYLCGNFFYYTWLYYFVSVDTHTGLLWNGLKKGVLDSSTVFDESLLDMESMRNFHQTGNQSLQLSKQRRFSKHGVLVIVYPQLYILLFLIVIVGLRLVLRRWREWSLVILILTTALILMHSKRPLHPLLQDRWTPCY